MNLAVSQIDAWPLGIGNWSVGVVGICGFAVHIIIGDGTTAA